MRSIINKAIKIVGNDRQETRILETAYCDENLYDHPERWELILSMDEFDGPAPSHVSPDSLAYNSNVIRVDGTRPDWCDGIKEELTATVDCIIEHLAGLSWTPQSGCVCTAYIPRAFLPKDIEVSDELYCSQAEESVLWYVVR